MKRIIVAIAVLAVVIFSGKYYYGRQVEKNLDKVAIIVSGMGGNLDYAGVNITLGGEVHIEDVRLSAPGLDYDLRMERVALRTGSMFGVHTLATEVRKGRIPEQLGLSIEGLQMPVDGGGYGEWFEAGAEGSGGFSVAGCGDRIGFSDKDYTEMGYGGFVLMDTHLDYHLVNEGQWFDVVIRSVAENMHDMSVEMDFALNAPSRDTAAIGMAMAGAELTEVRVDYNDRGYITRVLDFCQKESGLNRSDYLALHLAAWQDAWKANGLIAGENMVAAYGQFLKQPNHFSVSAKPVGDLGLMAMQETAPELLLYQFQMAMEVNHVTAGRLDLTVMDPTAKKAWLAEHGLGKPSTEPKLKVAPEREQTMAASARRRNAEERVVAVEDLRNHLNAYVVLQLTNERTVEGRMRQFDEDALQLQSYQSGGSITMPVIYSQIIDARIKNR